MDYTEKQQALANIIGAALVSEGINTKDILIECNGNHPAQIAVTVIVTAG